MIKARTSSRCLPRWPYIVTIALAIAGLILVLGHDHTTPAQAFPRRVAFGNDPWQIITHSTSDFLIGTSYMVISATIGFLAYCLRHTISFHWIFVLCSSFVLSCGLTHYAKVVTVFFPLYFLASIANIATTVASVGTAMALPYVIPQVRALIEKAKIRAIEREDLNESLQASEANARDLAGQVLTAEQQQKTRLSREIHDTVTQDASATYNKLQTYKFIRDSQIEAIQAAIDAGDKPRFNDIVSQIEEPLDNIIEMARGTVQASRRIIEELRPTILDDFGLPRAIGQRVNAMRQDGWDITYDVHMPDDDFAQRPSAEIETELYRVTMEALSNAEKHSQATHIEVVLRIKGVEDKNPIVNVVVKDNGVGFNTHDFLGSHSKKARKHIGLESMSERVRAFGGSIEIKSAPGEGVCVTAEMPVDDSEQQQISNPEGD